MSTGRSFPLGFEEYEKKSQRDRALLERSVSNKARASDVEVLNKYIDQLLEEAAARVGVIEMFGGDVAPDGYLILDGSTVTDGAIDYPALAAVYPSWVSGDDLVLPDMRDRFPVGASGTKAEGSTGGAATHTHSTPAHSHSLSSNGWAYIRMIAGSSNLIAKIKTVASWSYTHIMSTNAPSATSGSNTSATELGGDTDSGGAGTTGSASSLPPYLAVNFIVKT